MTDNEMIAQIDYDRFHTLVSRMYGGIVVTPPVRKGRK